MSKNSEHSWARVQQLQSQSSAEFRVQQSQSSAAAETSQEKQLLRWRRGAFCAQSSELAEDNPPANLEPPTGSPDAAGEPQTSIVIH